MSDFLIVRPFEVEPGTEFSRASVATYFDADGILQTAQIDEPRYAYDPETGDFEGLLEEAAATNGIRNNTMQGAVAGTPGTVPTNWFVTTTGNGLTRQIVGTGTEDGIEYIDIRWSGTASAQVDVTARFDGVSNIAATAGQDWVLSLYMRLVAGSLEPLSVKNIYVLGTNGVTQTETHPLSVTPTDAPLKSQRIEHPVTLINASTTNVVNGMIFRVDSGDVVDFTLRFGLPQLERGTEPTSVIKTSGSAVTRSADIQGDGLTTNVAEDDYDEYDAGTTYDLGDRVMIISGGSPEAEVHNVYESLIDSNTGNYPLDDAQFPEGEPTNWILVGKTNRWKMFDQSNSSQTVNADSIDVALKVSRRPNSLALLNVECSEIQVTQVNASGTIVYQETFQMIESSGQPSYYGWFFQQIQRRKDLFIRDLPPVAGSTISIRILNEGGDAKCGTCLVGYAEEFGSTQLGAEVGIQDFSVKRQNEFGDFQIRERAYSRVGRFPVFVPNNVMDRMQNMLAERRATATLYVAAEDYRCTYIYGFYEDMANVIQYNDYSLFNIRAIGLT